MGCAYMLLDILYINICIPGYCNVFRMTSSPFLAMYVAKSPMQDTSSVQSRRSPLRCLLIEEGTEVLSLAHGELNRREW